MKTLRKIMLNASGAISVLALAALLFAACAGPYEPPASLNNDGKGYVTVSIAPDASVRTMLPAALQLYYKLTFNDGTNATPETLGGALQKTVALLPGTYTLAVHGYRNPYEAENGGTAVVNGSPSTSSANPTGSFTVGTGTNPPVDVILTATSGGTGTLRYTLNYPTDPQIKGGRIYVEQLGGAYTTLITPAFNSGTVTGTIPNLPSDYYQVTVYLSNGRTAIKSDLAHIYNDLETEAKFVFDLSSFADVADLSSLTTAIATAKAASNAVRISEDGTGITAGHTWVPKAAVDTLNDAIAVAETVVANYGAGLTNTEVNTAETTLNNAVSAFNSACATVGGTYTPGSNVGLYVGAAASPETMAGTTLASALAWLQTNATSNMAYTVLLGDDETLPPWTLGGYDSGTNVVFKGLTGITLTLRGENAERVIQLSGPGSLFTVKSGVTLVLAQNITLRGRSNNNASLVYVDNGTVVMNDGAKITGNTDSSSSDFGGGACLFLAEHLQ
jgi:hypothetical protein